MTVRPGGPPAWDGTQVVEADGVITVLAIRRLLAPAGTEVPVDLGVVDHLWPRMPEDPQADPSWTAEPIVERLSPGPCDQLAASDLATPARTARAQGRPGHSRCALLDAALVGCPQYQWGLRESQVSHAVHGSP